MGYLSYSLCVTIASIFALIVYFFNASSSFLLKSENRERKLYILTHLSMSIWSFAFFVFFNSPDIFDALTWFRLGSIGYCTYYAFAFHFSILVCKNRPSLVSKVILVLIYLTCIPFICLFFIDDLGFINFYFTRNIWQYSFKNIEPWYIINQLTSISPMLITFYLYGKCIRQSASPESKKKYVIITITQFISFSLGLITNIIAPILNITFIPPIAHIFVLIYDLGLNYLIKSHNLISLTPAIAAQQIVSKVIDMIILTDPYSTIIEVNDSVRKTLGYTDSDLLGEKVSSLFCDPEVFKPEFNLNTSDININGFCVVSMLGTRIPVKLSISKICDTNGTLLGNVYVLQDMRLVSRLKEQIAVKEKLTKSLIETNEQLKELDKIKSNFICNISHELRTPINLMSSCIKLSQLKLQQNGNMMIPEQMYKYLDIMNQNCFRLIRIINNIIDITKIDSNCLDLNLKNVNIVSVTEEITLSVAQFIRAKDISLLFDTEFEEKYIACDLDQIQKIILNLLSNAVKFTNEGGQIIVTIGGGGNFINLSVKDTGIGISSDKLHTIFDRFIQIDKSLSRAHEGTGIGLFLVKLLVDLHHGTITVDSTPDIGSTFTVSLPDYTKDTEEIRNFVHKASNDNNLLEKISIEFSDIYL